MRGKFLMVVVEGKVHVMQRFGLGLAAHQGFLPTHALCAESRQDNNGTLQISRVAGFQPQIQVSK
jgi:hypothetical protein